MEIKAWLRHRLTWISLVCGTVVSVAGAFAVFDIEFPRPALASEIHELAENLVELDSMVTSQQLDDTKLRLYQNQREQQTWEKDSGWVPDFLVNEKIILERKIDNLENRLDKLRNED